MFIFNSSDQKIVYEISRKTSRKILSIMCSTYVRQERTSTGLETTNDRKIRKNEYEKQQKYQGLEEKLQKVKAKTKVIKVIIGAQGLCPLSQKSINRFSCYNSHNTTYKKCQTSLIYKSVLLEIGKKLRRTFMVPRPLMEDSKIIIHTTQRW